MVDPGVGVGPAATAVVSAMAVQRAMLLLLMLLTKSRRPGDDHPRCRVFPLRIVKVPITMKFTDQSLILRFCLTQQHHFNVIAYLLGCTLAKWW